jgi:type IV pilus assembly protein PilE
MIFCASRARQPTPSPSSTRGFTLIEVMVVVAILGILASIAYPSYAEYVKRGRRAKAQTALLEAAQYMQRFYAANNRYNYKLDGTTATSIDDVRGAISNSGEMAYTVKFADNSPTATGFKLVAEPTANGLMVGDKCGSFTLDQTGFKSLSGQNTGLEPKDCWK